jgi:putative phosphoesterase
MRLALISDQHGNDVAFRTVADDVERIGADSAVCLGDVVQGGAQPAQTLERLAALGCPTIFGNADHFLLDPEVFVPEEPPTPEQLEVREWTLSQLEGRHLEQIRDFVPTLELEVDGHRLVLFHGSPHSHLDVLLPERETDLEPWSVDADLLAGGHTHRQWTRRIGDALFVNPGSVGLAYDWHQPEEDFKFDAVAEYALVTVDAAQVSVEFRRVPYPLEELREVGLASGRPHVEGHLGMYRT